MPIQIVIADDQPLMRDTIRLVAEAAGFVVVAQAADAAALVDAALRAAPDVVVTDLTMGADGDGLEAATAIRAARPATGVILLSQFDDPRYAEAAAALGGEYLLKERLGDVDAFAAAVRRVAAM